MIRKRNTEFSDNSNSNFIRITAKIFRPIPITEDHPSEPTRVDYLINGYYSKISTIPLNIEIDGLTKSLSQLSLSDSHQVHDLIKKKQKETLFDTHKISIIANETIGNVTPIEKVILSYGVLTEVLPALQRSRTAFSVTIESFVVKRNAKLFKMYIYNNLKVMYNYN